MISYYRGHVIVMLCDVELTAEITDRRTGVPLPTKVSALLEEGSDALLKRAKALVDKYIVDEKPLRRDTAQASASRL